MIHIYIFITTNPYAWALENLQANLNKGPKKASNGILTFGQYFKCVIKIMHNYGKWVFQEYIAIDTIYMVFMYWVASHINTIKKVNL